MSSPPLQNSECCEAPTRCTVAPKTVRSSLAGTHPAAGDVEDNGDGSVVDEFDDHVRTEAPVGHGYSLF